MLLVDISILVVVFVFHEAVLPAGILFFPMVPILE
jgi:hypothetical protein